MANPVEYCSLLNTRLWRIQRDRFAIQRVKKLIPYATFRVPQDATGQAGRFGGYFEKTMIRLAIIFFLTSLFTETSAGQCTLTIHQVGVPTDTIFVGNYEEDQQPKRINDSTVVFVCNTATAERIGLMIDRPTKWWTTVWMEPHIEYKEIIIDYTKKEIRLIEGSEWDSVTLQWRGLSEQDESDSFAMAYIQHNPDSYLSLFFLSHGAFRDNPDKKKAALNTLSAELKEHPEYRQTMAGLLERKYPRTGDSFKEFALPDVNETIFNSATVKNKWILLNFWSNGCAPCIKEIDEFNDLYSSINKEKITFISIALDPDKTKWKKAKTTNKIMWTSLWTEDNFYCELCLNYNVFAMPFFILFDNDKKIVDVKDGAGELESIKSTLKENNLLQ